MSGKHMSCIKAKHINKHCIGNATLTHSRFSYLQPFYRTICHIYVFNLGTKHLGEQIATTNKITKTSQLWVLTSPILTDCFLGSVFIFFSHSQNICNFKKAIKIRHNEKEKKKKNWQLHEARWRNVWECVSAESHSFFIVASEWVRCQWKIWVNRPTTHNNNI